ncbi:hypothetical protein ABCR88_07770 [Pseudomonas sp. W17]|uniref:Uncharacterized protein n=1 Tax=Pseudomonas sp. W17 TaxID=3144407 RepID=A0AAU7X2Q9_9PSED
MTAPECVLGVLGVCRVCFGNSTQVKPFYFKGSSAVCWVCWVSLRGRACVTSFAADLKVKNSSHARTEKPNKPNTLNTKAIRALNLLGFICVGFVLGWVFFVSGMVSRGMGQ